jgi:uncharacterized protein (TIGR00299 family) protein
MGIESKKVKRAGISGTKVDVIAQDTAEERHLSDILEIIDNSAISPDVKKMARAIFRRLANAESKVHGVPVEEVHFHEIGAIDTIADVVGASICVKLMGIEEVFSSPVNVGSGMIKTSHGLLPVPAPATIELLKGIPIYSSGPSIELTTPTGAAIVAELSSGFSTMPPMKVERIGYGAGKKDLEMPNLLRVMIGEKNDLRQKAYSLPHKGY